MNLKLTKVLGDVTGVTGLKMIRAILNGERDPIELAKLRDRRCKHTRAEIAIALDGRYRAEHVLELRCSLARWEKYQEMIAVVDASIDTQLQTMKQQFSSRRGQGEVEPDAAGQRAGGTCVALGGVESAAE
jgi:hypothetical protein